MGCTGWGRTERFWERREWVGARMVGAESGDISLCQIQTLSSTLIASADLRRPAGAFEACPSEASRLTLSPTLDIAAPSIRISTVSFTLCCAAAF